MCLRFYGKLTLNAVCLPHRMFTMFMVGNHPVNHNFRDIPPGGGDVKRGLMIIRIVCVLVLLACIYGLYWVETYPLDGDK